MKSIVCVLAAALVLLAVPAAASKPSAVDEAAIAAVETRIVPLATPTTRDPKAEPRTLAARMAELKVPGVSVAFIEDGEVKWAKAYGVATVGGKPVTTSTLFQAASMSKALAAAAALRLVDQGRLDLDGDINAHISAWKVPASPFTADKKVTLRALLSHTAGMTVSGFPGYVAGKPVPGTVLVLNGEPPANTPAVRSFEAPGKYAYSGGGYTVAQLAITEAGLRAYGRMLDDLVLGPAGMRQSTFAQPLSGSQAARATSGHDNKGAVIPGGRNVYPEFAAAGLWTTPSDYGRFLIALQDAQAGRPGALLRQATAQAMMTSVDPQAGYGLGVGLGARDGHPYIQHGGGNAGYRCTMIAFLDGSRQGLVVMTNGDGGGRLSSEIVEAVAAAYGWGAPDPTNKSSPRRAQLVPPPPAK